MKLTVLVDNNAYIDKYLLAEPALSFFIEDDGRRILFDCGYSDTFLKNAEKLKIDLLFLDYLVFSHNHNDHTWGLPYLITKYSDADSLEISNKRPVVIGHPELFRSTLVKGVGEIGSIISEEKMEKNFGLNLNKEPVNLTENLIYLGEIPRNNDFEALEPIGIDCKRNKPDYMPDDTALAYKTDKGLIIITGCSHSGICNICEYAKKVCSENRILDIIGGLHLLNPSEKQIKQTLRYIECLRLRHLYACHCTDFQSKRKLADVAEVVEVGTGLVLNY